MGDYFDRMSEGRLDELYWSAKYAEAECHEHGGTMIYDEDEAEWVCTECAYDDKQAANEEAYNYG